LCPVLPVFDELALSGLLIIQALTESHTPLFSIVIPVVVGSSRISHPIPCERKIGLRRATLASPSIDRMQRQLRAETRNCADS
jgi:hypothetical protein